MERTTVSPERKKRYERTPRAAYKLTPTKLAILQTIAQSRYLTTKQIADIQGLSLRAIRPHLRHLYEMELVDRMSVPGTIIGSRALLDFDLHIMLRDGYKELVKYQLIEKVPDNLSAPRFTTMPHEFAVRDVLAWASRSARRNSGDSVECWDCTTNLSLGGITMDALLMYRLAGSGVVISFVEVDMGTERAIGGSRTDRWATKIEAYSAAFADRAAIKAFTGGGANARLLITVPTLDRAHWILGRLQNTLAGERAYIVVKDALDMADVDAPVWARLSGWEQPFIIRS